MKSINIVKYALVVFVIFSSFSCYSQEINKIKILGTWSFNKLEFTEKPEAADSLELVNESKGMTITFKEGNKFITKRKEKDKIVTQSGDYSLTTDGRKIIQNNEQGEIMSLTDEELIIKIADVVIMHFKRELN